MEISLNTLRNTLNYMRDLDLFSKILYNSTIGLTVSL